MNYKATYYRTVTADVSLAEEFNSSYACFEGTSAKPSHPGWELPTERGMQPLSEGTM